MNIENENQTNNNQNGMNNSSNPNTQSPTNSNTKKAILGIVASIGGIVLALVLVVVIGLVVTKIGSKKLTCENTINLANGEIKFVKEITYKKRGSAPEKDSIIIKLDEKIDDEFYEEYKAKAPFLFRVYHDLKLDEDDFEITRKDNEMVISANTENSFVGKSFEEVKEKEEKFDYTCK